MVKDAQSHLNAGRPVFANFPLLGARLYKKLEDILLVEDGLIICDEANMVCPAAQWQSLPPEFLRLWTQSRKTCVDFWYSTQYFSMVNSNLRLNTDEVWEFECWMVFFHRARLWKTPDVEHERSYRFRECLDERHFWIEKKYGALYNTFQKIDVAGYLRDNQFDEADPLCLPLITEITQRS